VTHLSRPAGHDHPCPDEEDTCAAEDGHDPFASVRTIKLRTARGVLLGIAAAGISAPFALGIVALLSQVSAEAVGYYGLVTLVIGFAGLVAAGGPSLAARFGPTTGSLPNAVTYLQSVVAPIVAGGVGAAIAALVTLPGNLSPFEVAVLLSLGVLWLARQGELTASLRFGAAMAVQAIPTIFQFVALGVILIAAPSMLTGDYRVIVFGSYAVPLGMVGAWQLIHLWKHRDHVSRLVAMPPGLWSYMTGMEGVLVLSIVFASAERYLALTTGDGLKILGVYVAIYQLAEIIGRVPNLVGSALVPAFSLLDNMGDTDGYHRASSGPVAILGFLLATSVSMLAPLLVGLYGAEFHSGVLALSLLALAFGATAVSSLDMAYAQGTARLRLYHAGLCVGLIMFLPLTVVVASVTIFALARAGALLAQQTVLAICLPHIRLMRLRHICLTLVIGGAEVAARTVGGDVAALAPLWWLTGIIVYWRLSGYPHPRVLFTRIAQAARRRRPAHLTR
jgi:O-antigen/teichoic acid export membrane protein